MRAKEALHWIKECGIAMESGHRDVPSLTEFITGEHLRGSWWGHPKGHEIFRLSRVIRNSPDVLTCRVVDGKITYVHRDLWPALIKSAEEFSTRRLAAVKEIHTPSGKHKVTVVSFPEWVPEEVMKRADSLTQQEAAEQLEVLFRKRVGHSHLGGSYDAIRDR
ncbi:MAG TPA: hypothetical protein VJT71_06620 [Pyrinomonadaceae bacterium]|nr:hypothetical protein [Pyrinomonadaceae bacterium]